MPCCRSGSATVEALIALTLFTVTALAAAGSAALGLRAVARGSYGARAARSALTLVANLQLDAQRGPDCTSLAEGEIRSPGGEVARWSLIPDPRGREVLIELTHPRWTGSHPESLWSYIRCR